MAFARIPTLNDYFNAVNGVLNNSFPYMERQLSGFDAGPVEDKVLIGWVVREHARVVRERLSEASQIPELVAEARRQYRVADWDVIQAAQAMHGGLGDYVTWFDANAGQAFQRVLDKDRTSPPPQTPAPGAGYLIVSPSPTGAWAGHANDLAYWDGGTVSWVFFTPGERSTTFVQDENVHYRFTAGAWASFVPSQAAISALRTRLVDVQTAVNIIPG